MIRKPDPRKAVYLGKRDPLPTGMKTCTINVDANKCPVPELQRGRFFQMGMCFVPLEAYKSRPARKRGKPQDRKVIHIL
jgi:hypothetical protein